jgi:branched-chain amino acid transport system permease protein
MVAVPEASVIAQAIISGIMMGALYTLMAFGLQIVYGVMRIINVAHAVFMVFSCYLTYWIFVIYGIDPFISMIMITPILFAVGWAVQRFLVNPIVTAPHVTTLLLMFGIGQVLENLIAFYWTSNFKSVAPSYGATSVTIANLSFPVIRVGGFIVSIVILVLLEVFLMKTKIGKAIRATAQDREAAQAMGINVTHVYLISFGIAIASVAPAGAITSMIYAFYPTFHHMFTAKLFSICVLGGLGSITGVFVGSMIMGIAESLTGVIATLEWSPVIAYALLIIILIFRPRGLFGKA